MKQQQYLVFCKTKKEEFEDAYPDLDDKGIINKLQEEWDSMDTDEKNKFIPMGHDLSSTKEWLNYSANEKSESPKVIETEKNNQVKEKRPSIDPTEGNNGHERKRRRTTKKKYDVNELYGSDSSATNEDSLPPARQHVKLTKPTVDFSATHNVEETLEVFKLISTPLYRKKPICMECEKEKGDSVMVTCKKCSSSFHVKCVHDEKITDATQDFHCKDCTDNIHTCFSCAKRDSTTMKCSTPNCNRFYHEKCMKDLPTSNVDNKKFQCPLHTCRTCWINRRTKASKGQFYKCIKCPTAYHISDFCVAAGCRHLAGLNMICSKHFVPKKSNSHHVRIHYSSCMNCQKELAGGTLVCCDGCPLAFHKECVATEVKENEPWLCSDCIVGKVPHYGDIVWVKVGQYRWWPGEICHPRNIPEKIVQLDHHAGEFAVRFFGSYDFFWSHKARVFLFQDGDTKSKISSGGNKSLAVAFQRGNFLQLDYNFLPIYIKFLIVRFYISY